LCACQNYDIQFRAFYIIRNIVRVNQELATRIVETDLMDVLYVIQDVQDSRLVNDKVIDRKRMNYDKYRSCPAM
jgi:hypothetical protein